MSRDNYLLASRVPPTPYDLAAAVARANEVRARTGDPLVQLDLGPTRSDDTLEQGAAASDPTLAAPTATPSTEAGSGALPPVVQELCDLYRQLSQLAAVLPYGSPSRTHIRLARDHVGHARERIEGGW